MSIKLMYSLLDSTESQVVGTIKSMLGGVKSSTTIHHQKGLYLYYDNPKASVLLVAHIDTVTKAQLKNHHTTNTKSGKITIANKKADCLGADDRAGIYTILEYIRIHGIANVSILFTHGEETGGIGISAFVKDKHKLDHIKLAIEIDKGGEHNVACVYDDDDSKLQDYLTNLGYKLIWGSYTDICNLQDIGISAVNISANYYKQHTTSEYLIFSDIQKTIDLLHITIEDISVNNHGFKVDLYTYKKWDYSKYYTTSTTTKKNTKVKYPCDICGTSHATIITPKGISICLDCIDWLVEDQCGTTINDIPALDGYCDSCGKYTINLQPHGVNAYCRDCHSYM